MKLLRAYFGAGLWFCYYYYYYCLFTWEPIACERGKEEEHNKIRKKKKKIRFFRVLTIEGLACFIIFLDECSLEHNNVVTSTLDTVSCFRSIRTIVLIVRSIKLAIVVVTWWTFFSGRREYQNRILFGSQYQNTSKPLYKNNLFSFENRGKRTIFQKYLENIQSVPDGNVINEKRTRAAGNPMHVCVSRIS